MRYGIFVGTAGGTSMKIADALVEAFDIDEDDVINMEEDFDDVEDQMLEYDVLFIGSSTWGQGDVRQDPPPAVCGGARARDGPRHAPHHRGCRAERGA